MKEIYVVLAMTGTYASRFINFFNRADYVHVSISLDGKFEEMYSFSRIYTPFIVPAGFVHENFNKGVYARHQNGACRIYTLQVTDEQFNSLTKGMEKFKKDPKHYTYNYIGLPFMLANVAWKRKRKYTCSQFVAWLLQEQSGVVSFGKSYSLVKPQDFMRALSAFETYRGTICQYAAGF